MPGCTHPLDDGDEVAVGKLRLKAIAVPCHTEGSMVFHLRGVDKDLLFTGDTLFAGGCGATMSWLVGNQARREEHGGWTNDGEHWAIRPHVRPPR